MNRIVTGKEMKVIDDCSIHAIGIPSIVLMERAAYMLSNCIERNESKSCSIGIVVGMGNNGADGLAVARILQEKGFSNIVIWAVGTREKATPEWLVQEQIVQNLEIPLYFYEETTCFHPYDILVDGLFGIGLTREITGIYRDVIEKINTTSATVYAIDIPSGVCAENGTIMGIAVKADRTVTFGFAKVGCMLYPGAEYSGKVEVSAIGFPQKAAVQNPPSFVTYDTDDVKRLAKRPNRSNKGTFGKVLIVAGCFGMAGAAYLAASAAYACGAGLVRILTAEENREMIQTLLPEAIVTTWETGKEQGYYETLIQECCQWATVCAMGPGMGTSKEAQWLCEALLENVSYPLVMDADCLNLLAKYPHWKTKNKGNWILTPHPGEAGRLLNRPVKEITDHIVESARELAVAYQAVVVCKDARTIVDSGAYPVYINTSGNHAMAKGGSGDVLTGIIVGLLASNWFVGRMQNQKQFMEEMARLGVYIHGLAGDFVREQKSSYSLMASDLVKAIGNVLTM